MPTKTTKRRRPPKSRFADLNLWDISFKTGTFTEHTVTIVTGPEQIFPQAAIAKFDDWFATSDWAGEVGASYQITTIQYQGKIVA